MPLIRCQAVLPYTTNIPRDVITNTLYFGSPNGVSLSTSADTLQPVIRDFYLDAYATLGFAPWIAKSTASIRFYDLADPEPRQPEIRTMDLSTITTVNTLLPTEVSVVLSFHGAPTSGVPAARQRGRIYLGGLTNTVLQTAPTTGTFPTVNPTFINDVRDAAVAMVNNVTDPQHTWVVYSRATGGLTPWYDVVGGWIDNTPDTQRRRGVEATSRTTWAAT